MTKNKPCCGHCSGDCDEAARIQQRIFEREVDEELRQERLLALWRKYRFIIFGCIIGVIVGTVAVEWHKAWWQKTRLGESDRYENASVLAATGKTTEASGIYTALIAEGQTGYRYLAQLQNAGLLIRNDKKDAGLTLLKKMADDADAPQSVRTLATLSYVGQQVDTGDIATLRSLLAPILADTANRFYGPAVELAALLDLRAGQVEQAKALINTTLLNQNLDARIRERLTLLKDRG